MEARVEDENIPQQTLFVLNVTRVTKSQIVLATLEGREVAVELAWRNEQPSHPTEPSLLILSASQLDGKFVTMKHLGITVRERLGLPGRTSLDVSVRILFDQQVLGIHRPLATLMEAGSDERCWADNHCQFCEFPLRPRQGPGVDRGPLTYCYFCENAPVWHHGWCCPENPSTRNYMGVPHRLRYAQQVNAARLEPTARQ